MGCQEKAWACLSKLTSTLRGIICGKKFQQFPVFFPDFRRKLFEFLAKYLEATLSEPPCKCTEESFGKKIEAIFISLFLDGELKKCLVRWKKISRFFKICIVLLYRHILRENFNMFQFLLELERILFRILPKNSRQVFQNCIVRAQRSHLKKTSVFRKAKSLLFVFGFLA